MKNNSKNLCYCHSEKKFSLCCEPFLLNKETPKTPEELMRSRYSAYCLVNIAYIKKTMQGPALQNFNSAQALSNAKKCKWISLKIISTLMDTDNQTGYVEFIATYSMYGKNYSLHEKSEFHFIDSKWYYVDGLHK